MIDDEVRLKSERLVLEPLAPSHAHALYAHLLDERLYRFIPQDPPTSEHSLRERYTRLARRQSPDGTQVWLNWAIRLQVAAQYIGILQATIHPDQRADIAYMLFPPHWGHGYATEGLRRVVGYLQTVHRVHLLTAQVDTRNSASTAVLERLGFNRVATVRDADYFKGSTSDEHWYELPTTSVHADPMSATVDQRVDRAPA